MPQVRGTLLSSVEGAPLAVPPSMAGLSAISATVCAGPPLLASAPVVTEAAVMVVTLPVVTAAGAQ